jgi:hypothetical protein
MVLPLVGIAAGVATRAVAKKIAQEAIKKAAKNAAKKSVARKVSAKEAKDVAKSAVGKYPPSRPPREIVKRGTGLSAREAKEVSTKRPVTKTTTAPKAPAEIARLKAQTRQARLNEVLRPILPRGTAAKGMRRSPVEEAKYKTNLHSTGKVPTRNLNSTRPRELSADESRAVAQRKANDVNAAKDAKMRDAARRRDAKVAQDRPGPNPKAESYNRIEADIRAAKALKEIKARERAAEVAKRNASRNRTAISKRVTRKKLSKTRPLGK